MRDDCRHPATEPQADTPTGLRYTEIKQGCSGDEINIRTQAFTLQDVGTDDVKNLQVAPPETPLSKQGPDMRRPWILHKQRMAETKQQVAGLIQRVVDRLPYVGMAGLCTDGLEPAHGFLCCADMFGAAGHKPGRYGLRKADAGADGGAWYQHRRRDVAETGVPGHQQGVNDTNG